MGEVTQAELDQLRREVSEIRFLVEVLITRPLTDEQRQEWTPDRVQEWIDDSLERREYMRAFSEHGVYGKGLSTDAVEALIGAGLSTLPEVAAQPRRSVAALRGVGRVSIQRLDEAFAKRDLTWAEAS